VLEGEENSGWRLLSPESAEGGELTMRSEVSTDSDLVQVDRDLDLLTDPTQAKDHFVRLWDRSVLAGDPLRRCVVAAQLAGLEEDPLRELMWNLRALGAAEHLTLSYGVDDRDGNVLTRLYPSLLVGIAGSHRKLGNAGAAQTNLALARLATRKVDDDVARTSLLAVIDGESASLRSAEHSMNRDFGGRFSWINILSRGKIVPVVQSVLALVIYALLGVSIWWLLMQGWNHEYPYL
jgi:hypothetical protein